MQNPGARTLPRLRAPAVMARLLGLLLVLVGLAGLTAGLADFRLALPGGTAYYVLAGIGLLLSGVLLLLRQPAALWTYAVLVLATLGWSLWETGLDWWPLAARGLVLFLLGLPLLLPRVTRSLDAGSPYYDLDRWDDLPPAPALYGGGHALVVALAAFAAVAVASWLDDAYELTGTFVPASLAAPEEVAAPDSMPPGGWHTYGRTGHGQRHSPFGRDCRFAPGTEGVKCNE